MANNNVVIRIGFVLMMMSLFWIVMGAEPDITITVDSPAINATVISGTYEFVANITDSVDNITNVEFFYSNDAITWTSFDSFIYDWPIATPLIHRKNLTTTTLSNGTYQFNVTVTDSNSTNNIKSDASIFFIVANAVSDTTPPASVTGLTLTGNGTTWLLINWTNPTDPDFDHVKILKDGNLVYTTPSNTTYSYNITDLSSGTSYVILVKTVDIVGNVNETGETLTASTIPNTPASGSPVTVVLQNSTVTFTSVNTGGNTVETPDTPPPLSSGYTRVSYDYFNISTTADVTSPITIHMKYYPSSLPTGYVETDVSLYHWNVSTTQWDDVTTSVSEGTDEVIGTVSSLSPFVAAVILKPIITVIAPTPPSGSVIETIGSGSKTFKISVSQDATVRWFWNGNQVNSSNVSAGNPIEFTYTSTPTPASYTFSVSANNSNGSHTVSWNWTVRPKTYASGNRVWDSSKQMDTTYSWSPMSFYAFYYDVNDDVGNESLTINVNPGNRKDRTIQKENLIYTTKPEPVSFKYKGWGGYNVIGFMADKYFAAYTSATNSSITEGTPRSTIAYMQLHKILKDDKDSHTVRASSTYQLEEGYAVTLKDVGSGREAMVSILKDNAEVYFDFVEAGDTLVYSDKVGSVNDLPLIVLHINKVFMGSTDNMVQIDGIFQVSESYTSVNSGNNYGIMTIITASDDGITMKNKNSFTLTSGSTIDLMGDMKFIVAKNEAVLRFAPMIKRSGEYEVRGTISNNETNNEWTPLNFEGFYYNLDEDVGTERMTLNYSSGSRTVGVEQIVYTTTATPVSCKYSTLGRYNVIGFMAEKYFAGYIAGDVNAISQTDISTIERNQLHKVLIDDDTQRVIYAGSTLTLNDGYVIKIKDVNIGAGPASVWFTLFKDGNEVPGGDNFVEKGKVFKYEKDVGAVDNLPIIALRVDSIFRGREATAAFIKGTFQISESYTTVKSSDTFDKMKVEAVSTNTITMTNPNTVSLDPGKSDTLMKNIKLKVADSSVIRFYPYVLVNGSALAANQLAISVPSSMMVKDTISISVTSGTGTIQDNAEVSFDGEVIGTTNSTGKINYTLTKAGQHNFSATKLGYEKAIKAVQISEYVDNRLSLVLPEFIDQNIPVSVSVIVSGSGNAITGANITLDGTSIGTTDSSGILTYTFTASGKHNLAASRSGYISVQREIEVRMPFIEFKALDINFRPDVVSKGQNVYVWSNITNSGTKEGMVPIALIINETVVENKNLTLAPGKYGEVNFSHKIELPPGNYSVEILGQKTTMPVKDEPLNLFLVGGVITGLGVIAVYFLTSKNLMSVEAIKSKMNMETVNQIVAKTRSNLESLTSKLESLTSKFMKGGGKGGSPPPKFDPFSKFNK